MHGTIVRIEAYKADIEWEYANDGTWQFGFSPRSHCHLFCSEKGNHAGYKRQDNYKMKFYFDQLPEEILAILRR